MGFDRDWGFTPVPIGGREDGIAYEAYRRYDRGSGHPARLLYKGDDFKATDLAI